MNVESYIIHMMSAGILESMRKHGSTWCKRTSGRETRLTRAKSKEIFIRTVIAIVCCYCNCQRRL